MSLMAMGAKIGIPGSTATTSRTDQLVLATVNAPYKQAIGASDLTKCLRDGQAIEWPAHVVSFFTEVEAGLVLGFAAEHGVSRTDLAAAYLAARKLSGESNPSLEAELVACA